MKYTFTEIEKSDIPQMPRGPYERILAEFIESGKFLARLDVEWPEGTTNGKAETFVLGLKTAAKRKTYPVKVFTRMREIYLERLDMEA